MDPLKYAAALLNQQIWCWGQDIERQEGNWLLELGFQRLSPPVEREDCSSVYLLEMENNQRITLRGFGVFFGDDRRGGVFMDRYRFSPRYSTDSRLECPPWSNRDVPAMNLPSQSQRSNCLFLLLDLMDWIRRYEVEIIRRLGIEYRENSLLKWNDGQRPCIPAEQVTSAWREVSLFVASRFDLLLIEQQHSTSETSVEAITT